jgi:hypothetical protein
MSNIGAAGLYEAVVDGGHVDVENATRVHVSQSAAGSQSSVAVVRTRQLKSRLQHTRQQKQGITHIPPFPSGARAIAALSCSSTCTGR